MQHINLLALVNAYSVPRACNGTKIPGALLVLNSLKESLKFLSACCSLTSFVKEFGDLYLKHVVRPGLSTVGKNLFLAVLIVLEFHCALDFTVELIIL